MTIGENNIELVVCVTLAHIEHGASGESLHESVMLDIPKRLLLIHNNAHLEIDRIISGVESSEKRKKDK